MTDAQDVRAATLVQSVAIMALNDLLVHAGLIERGALAAQLRRWKAPEGSGGLQSMVEGLARSLDAEPFRTDARPRLSVVPETKERDG